MGVPPLLAWSLTAVFTATGLWFLLRAAKGTSLVPGGAGYREVGTGGAGADEAGAIDRVCSFAHALMSASMIAMAWQWGMSVPAWPQVLVFAVATAWFLWLTVRPLPRSSSGSGTHAHGSGPLAHLHHAVMMACMVWMLGPMAVMSAGPSGHAGHAGHGGGHMSSGMGGAMHASTPSPAVNIVLGAGLLLSAVAWSFAIVAWRPGKNGHSGQSGGLSSAIGDAACHGGMSVGMGVMLLTAL